MENVLVKVNDIIKVIEKKDAYLVVITTGKTWVCEKTISLSKNNVQNLIDYIDKNQGNSLIKLPLKKGGEQK